MDQLNGRLEPHVSRPVLYQDFLGQPAAAELLGVPVALGLAGHVIVEGIGIIEAVHVVFHAGLGRQGRQNAVLGAEAVLIVVRIGHGDMMQIALHRAAQHAEAEGLVDLIRRQPHEPGRGRHPGKHLPRRQAPALEHVLILRRLHDHGDAGIHLIRRDDRGDQLLTGAVEALGGSPRHRDDAGGRMARPGAILPVESVGQRAVGKHCTAHADLAAVYPERRFRLADAAGLSDGDRVIGKLHSLGAQRHADRLHSKMLGALPHVLGDVFIFQICRELGQCLRIIGRNIFCVYTIAHNSLLFHIRKMLTF